MNINKFLGGLDTDAHPSQQKENTIRYGLNFIPMTEDGNLYSITNESGTELMSNVKFPTGFKPIGHTILNNEIIVILCNASGNSQIGYIIEDNNPDSIYGFYHPSGPISNTSGDVLENNSELGFSQIHPVDCVSRKLINGHRLLYFTDNNVPYGYFDLDEPPIEGVVAESVKLTFDQKIPKINVTEIIEGASSSIRPGVVQFITRYVTATGGTTIFGIPSEIFPMVPSLKTNGSAEYSGSFYEDAVINKNLKIQFDNVDTKYQELEIVALFYESSASIFSACIVGQVSIPQTGITTSVEFTYTGPNTENLVKLSKQELQQIIVSYTHAKCIEQKDNTLYLSNLRDERTKLSGNLQSIANKVKVKYRIDKIQYSGRGTYNGINDTASLVFDNIDSPFLLNNFTVTLLMNESIDPITGSNINNFFLKKNGQVSDAKITVSASTTVVGDTVIITPSSTYTGSQTAITITAIANGTVPTLNEFAIGANDIETAQNIFNTLLNSTDVLEFFPNYNSGNNFVDLFWTSVDVNTNGSTVISSNTAAITTINFANANTTVQTLSPTSAVVSDTQIDITFGQTVSIGDELAIGTPGFYNIDTNEYFTTGSDGIPVIGSPSVGGSDSTSEPGFTDYTNEFLTATKKGYRRGEVYSLGFKILYKDGSMSPAYHIPGEVNYVDESIASTENKFPPTAPDLWPTTNSGNGSGIGKVGTYLSQDTYPLDQGYPGDQTGDDITEAGPTGYERNVRHHYMPKLLNEPHYTNDNSGSNLTPGIEFIRVLGLDFEFTTPIPQNILKEAEEIIFLRERRNTDQNKSVYAQGVVHKHMVTADSFDNDGVALGTVQTGGTAPFINMLSSYCIKEIPFFNLSFGVQHTNAFERNGAKSDFGLAVPSVFSSMSYFSGTYQNGRKRETHTVKDQVMFYSPESVLLSGFKLNETKIIGYSLQEELKMEGILQVVGFEGDNQSSQTPLTGTNKHKISKYMYADFFCQYTKVNTDVSNYGTPSVDILGNSYKHEILNARYLEPNVARNDSLDPNQPNLKTSTLWNNGGLQLFLDNEAKTASDYIYSDNSSYLTVDKSRIEIVNSYDPSTTQNGVEKNVSEIVYKFPTNAAGNEGQTSNLQSAGTKILNIRNLYNLSINNIKQYGQINNANYIPIGRFSIKNGNTFTDTYTSVYGGDTFITKFSFNSGTVVTYRPFFDTGLAPINSFTGSNTQRPGGYANIVSQSGTRGTKVDGWDYRTCTFYFVESDINTQYRHRPADETKQNYFPNNQTVSAMLNDWIPYFKNIQAYNTQYSYENNVIESFLSGSSNTTISEFENRTIYSEQAAEDDTLDAYRSFLVNDYYDLPSEKGPIWDTFVQFNTLFMHTPKALWQTFAEGQATIKGGNIADAVLGTSRLFARPAQEVLETDGGYGGSISQFGGAHTQLGYIFADILQGKIFLVGATKTGSTILKEISKEGISTYIHKELSLGITKINGQTNLTNVSTLKSHLIDNPYLGIGIVSGYDYKLNRYLITKFPVTGQTDGFTLSYAKDIVKWFNYHSYKPNIYISYNNRFLFVNNTKTTSEFHEMNIGPKGSYFGTTYDSELTFVVTTKGQTCTFNNIVINSISKDRTTNIKQRDDNFYKMSAHNQISNTGPYTMIPSNTFGVTVSNGELSIKYRNNEYRITIPRDSVIDNSTDLFATTNLDNTAKFRERIKGDYIIVNLKYDNTKNLEFVLNFLKSIFTNNFR